MSEYFWTLSNLNATGKHFANWFMASDGSSKALIYIRGANMAIKVGRPAQPLRGVCPVQ